MVPLNVSGAKKSKHVEVALSTRTVPLTMPPAVLWNKPPIWKESGPVATAAMPKLPFIPGGGGGGCVIMVEPPPHPNKVEANTEVKR